MKEHQLLNELITDLFGIHYPEAKRRLLESRLRPRLRELHLSRFMDYYLCLERDGRAEIERLARLVTNNETYFFRETRQFEALFEEALEDLKRSTRTPGRLRMLCAGCASGEEPYSLAIYRELYAARTVGTRIAIDAFDIDLACLDTARKGSYRPNSLRVATEEQIREHFARGGAETYSLNSRYRRDVRFARGNILERGTYPSRELYDVVFCRNVLIYFSEPALHRAIENFAGTLRSGGILFLGHSESIIGMRSDLETIRLKKCIAYRKVG